MARRTIRRQLNDAATAPAPRQTPVPPRPKPSRLPAWRSIFNGAGVKFEESADERDPWRVEGRFNFWPLSGRWSEDSHHPLNHRNHNHPSGRHGYSATELVAMIRADRAMEAEADKFAQALAEPKETAPEPQP